jgi:peptidoglycan hydrolase-like protein with peptidoglycan-binding domain
VPERISRSRAAVADIDASSGLLAWGRGAAAAFLRICMRRPADTIGGLVAVALVIATLVNALFLQAGKHPAPLMTPVALAMPVQETTGSLAPAMPRPRPAAPAQAAAPEATEPKRTRAQLITDIQRELARRGFYDGAIDGVFGPKMDAAIREFEAAAKLRPSGEPSEALWNSLQRSSAKSERAKAASAQKKPEGAASSRRVTAVQRALTDYGYGPLRLSGVVDEATRSAIEKFERERKLPVKGQLSDRMLRELSAVTGRPFVE